MNTNKTAEFQSPGPWRIYLDRDHIRRFVLHQTKNRELIDRLRSLPEWGEERSPGSRITFHRLSRGVNLPEGQIRPSISIIQSPFPAV